MSDDVMFFPIFIQIIEYIDSVETIAHYVQILCCFCSVVKRIGVFR